MSAQLLDGLALAKQMKAELKMTFASAKKSGLTPTLAVLRVGDDEAAAGYARAIAKNCQSVGADFRAVELPGDATHDAAEQALRALNDDSTIHGIMILEPLPVKINGNRLIDALDPRKDIDGVHPLNIGRLAAQRPALDLFVPATPAGGRAEWAPRKAAKANRGPGRAWAAP